MKVAVIADNGRIPRFALDALDRVAAIEEISVFSCTNTTVHRRLFRHGAYYALNFFTVRNRLTRFVPVTDGKKPVARSLSFESGWDGAWQVLPDAVVERLQGFDLILKFGMGLMRVPPPDQLSVPILSYHHGDPDRYRGRPAGFWEMAEGVAVMGQMVQVIGNRLDAGRVVAFAETKVFPWSYRATLLESYRHSPLILARAIDNALAGRSLPKPCKGRNYRLPTNATVCRVLAAMAWRYVARLLYGALFEKGWRVSTAPLEAEALAAVLESRTFPPSSDWRTLDVPKPYSFYADPFFSGEPRGLLVEALDKRTGLGEIVLVADGLHRCVSNGAGHMSYPATVRISGREIVLPEVASWSRPWAATIRNGRLEPLAELRVEGGRRVVDPTLIEHQGRLYLFGTLPDVGSSVLYLWTSESLGAPFEPHPESPVRLSPEGSRMGGAIIDREGRLVRLGQDFSRGYGDGLFAFEIEILTPQAYRERPIGRLAFSDRKGPHTLNVGDGALVFDWYVDRFSPLAGLRRLAARRRRQPPRVAAWSAPSTRS